MKKFFVTIFALICLFALTQPVLAQTNKYGVLANFSGFGNTEMTPFNGGAGMLYYFDLNTAVRGSIGGSSVKSGSKEFTISAGITHDMFAGKQTVGYGILEGIWKHKDIIEAQSENSYGAGVGLGAAFYAWPSVSFNFEYTLRAMYDVQSKLEKWDLGLSSPTLGVTVYFDKK
jgi:hypothetical protein